MAIKRGANIATKDRLLKHLELDSFEYLRITAVLAMISHTSVTLRDERTLTTQESQMLEIITKVTQGGKISVEKGAVTIIPGRIVGGTVKFNCSGHVLLSYYLEPLVYLSVFASEPMKVTLTRNGDPIDTDLANNYSLLESFCSAATVILRKIGCLSAEFKFKEPHEVIFTNSPLVKISPIEYSKRTKVKKIRGGVLLRCLQPALGNNVITGCKRVLNQVCDNIYLDLLSPKGSGKSYVSVALIAEGSNVLYTADQTVNLKEPESEQNRVAISGNTSLSKILEIAKRSALKTEQSASDSATAPTSIHERYEEIGTLVAKRLIAEISLKGMLDTTHQHIPLVFMAMSGDYQISKLRVGRLNSYSIEFLRRIKQFLGVSFKFEQDEDSLVLKCVGNGFHNSGITTF